MQVTRGDAPRRRRSAQVIEAAPDLSSPPLRKTLPATPGDNKIGHGDGLTPPFEGD